jgi:hypothetical protein
VFEVTIEDTFDKVEASLRCSRIISMNIYIYIYIYREREREREREDTFDKVEPSLRCSRFISPSHLRMRVIRRKL